MAGQREDGPDGSVNENKIADGAPDDLAENLSNLDEFASTETYDHYSNGWAMAYLMTALRRSIRMAWAAADSSSSVVATIRSQAIRNLW